MHLTICSSKLTNYQTVHRDLILIAVILPAMTWIIWIMVKIMMIILKLSLCSDVDSDGDSDGDGDGDGDGEQLQ